MLSRNWKIKMSSWSKVKLNTRKWVASIKKKKRRIIKYQICWKNMKWKANSTNNQGKCINPNIKLPWKREEKLSFKKIKGFNNLNLRTIKKVNSLKHLNKSTKLWKKSWVPKTNSSETNWNLWPKWWLRK